MDLTLALCQTVHHQRGPTQALATVLRQLPAGGWRADTGQPCVLEALLESGPKGQAPDARAEDMEHRIALFEWLFTERAAPSPAVCLRLLEKAMLFNAPDTPFTNRVWDLAGDRVAPEERPDLLLTALAYNWDHVAQGVLALGCPTELDQQPAVRNPFTVVRSLGMFNALVSAGFSPFQRSSDHHPGYAMIRSRENTTFNGGPERDAIVRQLSVLAQALPVREQALMAMANAQKWNDFQTGLKTIGPAWMDVRTDNGGTLLHVILHDHPEWMPKLIRRQDLRSNPALWSVLNQHGEHALMVPWFRMDADSMKDWWGALQESPEGQAVLSTLPVMDTPSAPFARLLAAAFRRHKVLPSLTSPDLWDLLGRMGGYSEDATRQRLLHEPAWQEAFEKVVWNPRQKKAPGVQAWAGLTLWANAPDHPWVMGFRLLEIAGGLYSEQALLDSPTLTPLQGKALAACQDLIDRGAPWGWAQDKVQRNRVTVPNTTGWRVLGAQWENQQLRQTLDEPDPDVPSTLPLRRRDRSRL